MRLHIRTYYDDGSNWAVYPHDFASIPTGHGPVFGAIEIASLFGIPQHLMGGRVDWEWRVQQAVKQRSIRHRLRLFIKWRIRVPLAYWLYPEVGDD